jgi:two-component system, cell cycle sensor histidine kinase and response regulator CckA
VESSPGQGTQFEVYLPQTGEAVPVAVAKNMTSLSERQRGTVLLAEDEEAVRELACEFLRTSGYNVIVAKDGVEALELVESQKTPIDILVTDVVMPRMRGTELAQRLRSVFPAMKIVYMSGYLEHSTDNAFFPTAEQLQKPFSRESLLHKLRDSTNRTPPVQTRLN